ncbi:hypothetical protein KRR26_13425 [Corallococcus sp. M34]|nr:hypothetical protein [Citreicoccus inhibens]
MRTAFVKTWFQPFLAGALLLATPALAQQDDAPYDYPDDEPARTTNDADDPYAQRRRTVDQTDDFRNAAEHGDDKEGFEKMSRLDDPNLGVAAELMGGLLLLDSARGNGSDKRLAAGLRVTWEFGRLIDNETLHEALFADLRWLYGSLSDGTTLIRGDTRIHYLTVAPAYLLRLGQSSFGFYGQAGAGIAYQNTSITVGDTETKVNGLKPVLQYGVGLRGRPSLNREGNLHLTLRLEAMGLRRGYLNDFYLGASAGVGF